MKKPISATPETYNAVMPYLRIKGAAEAVEFYRRAFGAKKRMQLKMGDRIGHADIAVATVLSFVAEAHPGLISLADFPGLNAHAARLEALPVFQAIRQPFIPPA